MAFAAQVDPMPLVPTATHSPPAARLSAGDSRDARKVQGPNKAIKRIRSEIDSKNPTWTIYTGMSQEELSIRTSTVPYFRRSLRVSL